MIEKLPKIYSIFQHSKRDIYYLWMCYNRALSKVTNTNTISRNKKQFEILFNYMASKVKGQYNGQNKADFAKNYKRIEDIVTKSAGDEDRAIALSKTQANRIFDEWKAINRAMAAKELKQEHIFDVFFHRAYELGNISKQEYRDYKLEKLGI